MLAMWRGVALLGLLAVACSAEPLDLAEFPPDGVLDCTDDSSWVINGSPDPNATGFATDEEAFSDTLAMHLLVNDDLRGPEIIRPGLASFLNTENREVVVVSASEVSPANWFTATESGCSGYDRL